MATYYWDPLNGSDSNSGTIGSPWLTIGGSGANSLETRFEAGHTCLIARGTVIVPLWNGSSYILDAVPTVHNNQYIGSYDAGYGDAKPIFDNLLYDNGTSGWVGPATTGITGVWSKDMSTVKTLGSGNFDGRCWAGTTGSSTRAARTDAFRLMSSAAACVANKQFYHTGTTVYVYTGGSTSEYNPYTYYGGLAFTVSPGASPVVARFQGFDGETIRDIEFRGGGILHQSDNRNFNYIDCDTYYACRAGNGINLNNDSNGKICENVKIIRYTYDAMTSASEDRGDSSPWSAMNGVYASCRDTFGTGYTANVEIVDMNGRGARHFGVNAQVLGTTTDSVRNIIVRATKFGRSVFDSSDIDYGRMIGVKAAGFLVYGLHSTGAAANDQFHGAGVVSGCKWDNLRDGNTVSGNQGNDNAVWISTRGSPALVSTNNIDFCNNIIVNPRNYPILISDALTNGFAEGDIRVYNNVIVDQTYYMDRTTQTTGIYSTWPGCIRAYAPSGTTSFLPQLPTCWNNVFVIPSGQTTVYVQGDNMGGGTYYNGVDSGNGRDKGVPLTVNDATASPVPFSNQVFISTSSAGLDSDYKPTSSSALYRAGTHVRYGTESNGDQRWNPPTVGAKDAD